MKTFGKYERYLDKNSIVVGHSIGPAFLLSVIEKRNEPIKAAFFVSGFVNGSLGNPKFDKINKSFTEKKFNWVKIKRNCPKFYVLHSDNDPYVPLARAKDLAKKLGTKVIIVESAGHFNESAGYKKFDLLLQKIKKGLK